MGNTLLIGAAKLGMHFVALAPKNLFPDEKLVEKMQKVAEESGAKIELTSNIDKAVHGADVIYTDVWVSMGEESKYEERIKLLAPYRVNMKMIKKTKNPNVKFMHCLPAFHDLNTEAGKEIHKKYGLKEMEVSDEVFSSKYFYSFRPGGKQASHNKSGYGCNYWLISSRITPLMSISLDIDDLDKLPFFFKDLATLDDSLINRIIGVAKKNVDLATQQRILSGFINIFDNPLIQTQVKEKAARIIDKKEILEIFPSSVELSTIIIYLSIFGNPESESLNMLKNMLEKFFSPAKRSLSSIF